MLKNLLKKSLASLGLTAFALGAFASVSSASTAWDSYATWTGYGGKADVTAYTSQYNEPWNYRISVYAKTNDGTSKYAEKTPAASDSIRVDFRTLGPVSSGYSDHEWVMAGEDGYYSQSIRFN